MFYLVLVQSLLPWISFKIVLTLYQPEFDILVFEVVEWYRGLRLSFTIFRHA